MAQEPHTSYVRVMESFVLPTVSSGAVSRGTRTRSPEAPYPWGSPSLPGKPGTRQLQPGRGCRQLARPVGRAPPCTSWSQPWHRSASHGTAMACGQTGSGGVWLGMSSCVGGVRRPGRSVAVGAFWGPGRVLQSHPTSELHWFFPHVFPAGILKAVGAAPGSTSSAPPSLPPCQCSSPWDGPSGLLGEPCAVPVPQCPPASCAHLYRCIP